MPATAAWRHVAALPVLLILALAFSMMAVAPADASQKSLRERKIHHGLNVAIKQKGDPYVYGADGPRSFDCSGLTMFSFAKAGLHLPRTSDAQARYARRIPKKNVRRGDFVFFHSGGNVYHVALFLGRNHGNKYILHAPSTGKNVQRDPIWTSSWFAGTLRKRG